uniref:PNPLA domain-containing protein n=2 Tax=Hemiselmis andersenii TaxID=464988 RepID=A0A7S1E6P0_HEMAN|mmetsp:Transcript_35412/g.86249  ORF Transcript_35412/g.86249 Transcript_35412/m.86249 type:complete len:328 (+) Transcript_35412:285-1268(+)
MMRRLMSSYGVNDGTVLARKVDDVIHQYTGLRCATFSQLYDHTGILLKIFATSMRNGGLIEFSAQKTPHDEVAMAARCSMTVPFLFDAVPTSEGDLLVDAALIDNCPVWCFDEPKGNPMPGSGPSSLAPGEAPSNPKTLAFWVASQEAPQHIAPRSIRSYCVRMIEIGLFMQQRVQKQSFWDDDRVLWVQAPDIPISTFRLDPQIEQLLHRCGMRSARQFIRRERSDMHKHKSFEGQADSKSKVKRGVTQAGMDDGEMGRGAHTEWIKEKSTQTAIDRFVRYWLSDRQRTAPLLPAFGAPLDDKLAEGGKINLIGNMLTTPSRQTPP